MNILDRFQDSTAFTPASPAQYFALQLARKLEDVQHLPDYVRLAERFGEDHLLAVYAQEVNRTDNHFAERFRSHFN